MSFAYVGPPLFGVVLGKRQELDSAFGIRDCEHFPRAFEDRELAGIADVRRFLFLGPRQLQNPFDFIADITEAPRLTAIAVDSKFVTSERLLHEV